MRFLLRYPDFARMWVGNGLSALGTHLSVLALPLLLLSVTGSATLAGLVATARLLAYTLTNLPAGALADRLPRRAVLLAADALRLGFMLAIGLSLVLDHGLPPWALIALGALDTAVSAVAGPVGIAALRHVVPSEEIASALALNQARGYTLGLVGPLLGGVLFAVAPSLPFLADAASYAVSLAFILTVRRKLGGGGSRTSTLLRDIADGLRFVIRTKFIIVFMTWAALVNFATAGLSFGLVLVLGPDRGGQLGGALTLIALAGMLGALVAPRIRGVGEDTIIRTATAGSVALGLIVAAHPTPVVLTACVAAMCLLGPLVSVPLNVRLFAMVPDAMMGRVQSSVFLIGGSLTPFAGVTSGWLAEHASPATAFATFTAILAVVLLICFLPGLRLAAPAPQLPQPSP